jgi:hypothetical protein
MSTTRTSLSAAFAMAFLLVVAPAARAERYKSPPDTTLNDHPSGKDRTVEPGNSGTQGKAVSDPDATTNGGADKPGMTGGFDSDKDGNNGCGNDNDFEDDNNGWCGHHPKPTHAVHNTTATTSSSNTTPTTVSSQVAGTSTTTAGASVLGENLVRAAAAPAAVLAESSTRAATTAAAAPSTLARTGADSLWLAGIGLLLMAMGGTAVLAADRRRLAAVRIRARR